MKITLDKHGAHIKAALEEGESYRQIARRLGCDHTTVAKFAAEHFPDLKSIRTNQYNAPSEVLPLVERPPLDLLVIDIETRPNLAYVWDVWNQNIQPKQLIEEKEVISFAAKWLGYSEIEFWSVHHHGKRPMVQRAWELLERADGVIHYNGKRFDVPHLNLEFLRADMRPPSPFQQIDLIKTVRREFKFTHNKLEHVSDKLGIGQKVEHEGFPLWLKCMEGDEDAWQRMRAYNIHDVELTEELYQRILPWITQHPSFAAVFGDKRCPNCGNTNLRANGWRYTKTGRYAKYFCADCGKHCRDTHRQSVAAVTETSAW